MTGVQTFDPVQVSVASPSAVAWIDGPQASVAMMSGDGSISTCEIEPGKAIRGGVPRPSRSRDR